MGGGELFRQNQCGGPTWGKISSPINEISKRTYCLKSWRQKKKRGGDGVGHLIGGRVMGFRTGGGGVTRKNL